MAETKERTWKTIESGPHTYQDALHPVVAKNYGKWKYHELLKIRVRVGDRDIRDALLEKILQRSSSVLIHRTGNVALIYRKAADPKLTLPKTS